MNQGAVQSSPPAQQIAGGRGSNWWRFPSVFPSSPPAVNTAPPSWSDCQELPQSWRNLLLGGLVEEEDDNKSKFSLIDMETEELETWEQQLLNQNSSTDENSCLEVTQESFCWPHQQMTSSSSLATLSSNMQEVSVKSSDRKHPNRDLSSHNKCDGMGADATVIMSKRPRIQASSFKVRKEKLGDRITALHQIVSPFGKTDTASVLLEAIGYIRFLQAQIQALSLPYMSTRTPSIATGQQDTECVGEGIKDLKSRGLCLVPISCTGQGGSEMSGADYWAPPFASNFL